MRITNGIINNNTKTNILVNKEYSDKLNTMVATGQKITRPSDDPIIAIRALRLNANITEINQFYDKNIPDAQAWLTITETALTQTESVLSSVQSYLTQGASDDNTAEDRKNILENIRALKDQVYSAGNADYAGRTVFTGYRTSESLTYTEDETDLITLVENFDSKSVDSIRYVKGTFDFDSNAGSFPASIPSHSTVEEEEVFRIRLAYNNLTGEQKDLSGNALPKEFTITLADGSEKTYEVDVKSLTNDRETDDSLYTDIGDDAVRLITDTGELILGKNVKDKMVSTGSTASFEYAKEDWLKNDIRPEHLFACKNYDDKSAKIIEYNYSEGASGDSVPDFKNQKLNYEVAYNQKIEINTNANEVFDPAIARDVDELLKVTQDCMDAEDRLNKLKAMAKDDSYSEAEKETIAGMLEAVQKEFDLYKDKMQDVFSSKITTFKDYTDKVNLKLAAVGSMRARLDLTKERVGDQLSNFKELADDNINAELTETAIDLKNAEVALQAAQAAAAKVASRTLLDYL